MFLYRLRNSLLLDTDRRFVCRYCVVFGRRYVYRRRCIYRFLVFLILRLVFYFFFVILSGRSFWLELFLFVLRYD